MSQPYRSDRATGQKVESSSSRFHSAQDKSYSSAPVCRFCRKEGHVMSNCFKLKQRRQGQNDSKPTGFISKSCNLPSNVNDVRGTIFEEKSSSDSVMQSFEPFIHNGFVSLSSDLTNSNLVKILRDTGASQSLLLANSLPFSDVSFTGTNVLIKGVDSTKFTSIPLHNAYLSSDLVSGYVVGILPSLPFDGVHLLLGNDLAGSKVEVNPLVTDKPSVDPNTDSIEHEIPGLFPSCAVTHSMTQSKSTSDDVTTDVDLADTFVSRMINDDNVSDVTNDDFSVKAQTFSRSDLIREQNIDPDFSCLFARSVDASDAAAGAVLLQEGNDGIDHPICYFSRKFNKNQRNYSTVEKECLALILALQHFEVYVTYSSFPIIVYSDHNPLVFLHKLRSKNQRLLRWRLMLQEFNIIVKHIRGKDNLIADCLSRM